MKLSEAYGLIKTYRDLPPHLQDLAQRIAQRLTPAGATEAEGLAVLERAARDIAAGPWRASPVADVLAPPSASGIPREHLLPGYKPRHMQAEVFVRGDRVRVAGVVGRLEEWCREVHIRLDSGELRVMPWAHHRLERA